jgi:hypothetical protein
MMRSGKTGLHKLKQDKSTLLRLLLMTMEKLIVINSVQLYNVRLLNYITYSSVYNSSINSCTYLVGHSLSTTNSLLYAL